MAADWYYMEDGKSVGPVSAEEIIGWIRKAKHQPHFVWTTGMSKWTDARTIGQFSAAFQMEEPEVHPEKGYVERQQPARDGHATLAQRAWHEVIAYLTISGYLLVWFSAVMFYKATILGSVGIEFAPFGLAAVKALILGKFILVMEDLKIGEGKEGGGILAVEILKKALLFTLLLIVLSIVEEVVVGHFHGRGVREVLGEIGGGTIPQAIATGVLMFLVLLPYFAFRRLAFTFGELPELLFTRRSPVKGGNIERA
jgi:hypothetical protein